LKKFNANLETTFEILGSFKIEALADEEKSRLNARRSLVAAKDIPKGKIIEKSDLTFKRPAHGISPKYIDDVVGKEAKEDIKEDDIIVTDLI
jgi:N-acetylneuraminate synthase